MAISWLAYYYDRLLLDSMGKVVRSDKKRCTICGRTDREFAEKADAACRMCVVASL